MARICPLTLDLLRPLWTSEVPSPPHDALTPEQRREHLKRFPHSYLGVTRAPEDVDDTSLTAHDLLIAGRRSLERLLASDVFVPADGPEFFIYRLTRAGHTQTGVVCGVAVSEYEEGWIRIHERIKYDRAQHLANHLDVVGAQSSPIALATRDSQRLTDAMAGTTESRPDLDFVTTDGLHQQIWRVTDPAVARRLQSILDQGPLYLIDGHHRAAAAAWHRRRDDHQKRPGDEWMLTTVFPADQMFNKAFHRVVDRESATKIRGRIGNGLPGRFVTSIDEAVARGPEEIAVGFAGEDGTLDWAVITVDGREDDKLTIVDRLDTSRLAASVLQPLLEIDESGPGGRLRYLPGLSTAEALSDIRLAAGEAVFVMNPVSMGELFDVSDEGLVMPPKSTYFEPKVRSGLFVHFKNRV